MQTEIVVDRAMPGRAYREGEAVDLSVPFVMTVTGFLAPDECERLIARIEAARPELAPITTARGPRIATHIRNNERVMFEDEGLARELFARCESVLPPRVAAMAVCGLNERFRCYRYQPGQYFAPHLDGAFWRSAGEGSWLTFMIYLNDGFGGGATRFHDWGIEVVPRAGKALLFQHAVLHEGCVLERGTKYVLRSDVMYRAIT